MTSNDINAMNTLGKRKWLQDENVWEAESDDTSSSDSDSFSLPQALPVSDGDLGDLSVPPRNPDEYLRRVRHEARSLPDVACWDAWSSFSNIMDSHSTHMDQESRNTELETSTEIKAEYRKRFEQVRQQIRIAQNETETDLPEPRDETAWLAMCWNLENSTTVIDIHHLPLEELSSLDHLRCIALIRYFGKWYDREKIIIPREDEDVQRETRRLGWLFGALAAVEPPLDADTTAAIRGILKHLVQIQRQPNDDGTEYNHLWQQSLDMLVTVMADVFRQGYGITSHF